MSAHLNTCPVGVVAAFALAAAVRRNLAPLAEVCVMVEAAGTGDLASTLLVASESIVKHAIFREKHTAKEAAASSNPRRG